MFQMLKDVPKQLAKQITVSQEYIEGFVRANNTFLYQLVYDPINRRIKPLHPYPEDIDIRDLNYAGPYPLFYIRTILYKL